MHIFNSEWLNALWRGLIIRFVFKAQRADLENNIDLINMS